MLLWQVVYSSAPDTPLVLSNHVQTVIHIQIDTHAGS